MLNQAHIESLAQQLLHARATKTRVRQCSKQYPDMTLEDAYAVQSAWVQLEIAGGRFIKGRKIGLTSNAIQQMFQASEPTHAPLMDDMYFVEGSQISLQRFLAPRIEAELAFILGRPLKGPGVTLFDALEAIAFVTPAIELVDARIEMVDQQTKGTRTVVDQVADFASCAGIILGGRPVRPAELDLRRVGAIVFRNSVIEETGLSAAVMNHPVNAVVWLANEMAKKGQQLESGELVLAGAFTKPLPVAAGDSVHVDFGALGSIAFGCSD